MVFGRKREIRQRMHEMLDEAYHSPDVARSHPAGPKLAEAISAADTLLTLSMALPHWVEEGATLSIDGEWMRLLNKVDSHHIIVMRGVTGPSSDADWT